MKALQARHRTAQAGGGGAVIPARDAMAEAGAGSSGIYATNPLDRALRDQLTISAHLIASTRNLEPAGRIRLGRRRGVEHPCGLSVMP